MHTKESYLSEFINELLIIEVLYEKIGDKHISFTTDESVKTPDSTLRFVFVSHKYCDVYRKTVIFDKYHSRMSLLVEQVMLEISSYSNTESILNILTRIKHLYIQLENKENLVKSYSNNEKMLSELEKYETRYDFIMKIRLSHDSDIEKYDYPNNINITNEFIFAILVILKVQMEVTKVILMNLVELLDVNNFSYKKELFDRFNIENIDIPNTREVNDENIFTSQPKKEMTFREISLFHHYMSTDRSIFSIKKNNCIEIASKYGYNAEFSGKKLLQVYSKVIKRTGRISICPNMSSYNAQVSDFALVLNKLKEEGSEKANQFASDEYKLFLSINEDFS